MKRQALIHININNNDIQVHVLKHFGHLIFSLSIENYDFPKAAAEKIYALTNLYCHETLAELELLNVKDHAFAQFQKPFVKIENVSFRINRRNECFVSMKYSLRCVALH